MKRTLQEYVELVVFGLVALLVGTGLLWLGGWVLSLGGIGLRWVAGLLWTLLRFIVPVAIAGGLVYFLVKAAQDRQARPATAPAPGAGSAAGTAAPATPAAATAGATTAGSAAPAGTYVPAGAPSAGPASDDLDTAEPQLDADPIVTAPEVVDLGDGAADLTPTLEDDVALEEVPEDPASEDERA